MLMWEACKANHLDHLGCADGTLRALVHQELFSYMRLGSRNKRDQVTEQGMRMDYLRARKPIQELYSAPIPGNGSFHTRPSYLGGGNTGYGSTNGGIQLSSTVGGGGVPLGGPEKGTAAPAVPPSAFAVAGRGATREDWGSDDGRPTRDEEGPSATGMQRPPLHPLPGHGSFTAQLPPRPSELLKVVHLPCHPSTFGVMASFRNRCQLFSKQLTCLSFRDN